jgi:hypothetical protein
MIAAFANVGAAAPRAPGVSEIMGPPDKPGDDALELEGRAAYASPTVSNMQAAMASAGDLEPCTRKSKAG